MVRKMIRNLAGTALLALAAMANPAAAQHVLNCTEHSKIVEFLGAHYSETLSSVGLINQAAILEVYVSQEGTWTMIVTNVNGNSCVVFAGDNWETLSVPPGFKTNVPAFGQPR